MKVINAKVEWFDRFSNNPTFDLLVDEDPNCWHDRKGHKCVKQNIYNNPDVVWHTEPFADGKTFAWYMNQDGFVYFFMHNPSNQNGYGGAVYTIYDKSGIRKFKGPWSSNSEFAAKFVGESILGGAMTCDPASFKQGYTFTAAYFTLRVAKVAAKLAGVELIPCLVKASVDDEISSEQSIVVQHGIPNPKQILAYRIKHPNKPGKWEVDMQIRQTDPKSYRD